MLNNGLIYAFLALLLLSILLESSLLWHILGNKLKLPYRILLLDTLVINLGSSLLVTLLRWPTLQGIYSGFWLSPSLRSSLLAYPREMILFLLLTSLTDALILLLYYQRKPVPPQLLLLAGLAMNLPLLLLALGLWLLTALAGAYFDFLRLR